MSLVEIAVTIAVLIMLILVIGLCLFSGTCANLLAGSVRAMCLCAQTTGKCATKNTLMALRHKNKKREKAKDTY